MTPSAGLPITFTDTETLRLNAVAFHNDPAIQKAVSSASVKVQAYYNNLDCAFVFDKESLQTLMDAIDSVADSGLVMFLGASNMIDESERSNKPTLSIFPCTVDKSTANWSYTVLQNPSEPGFISGMEHPGLAEFNDDPQADISTSDFI